MDKNRAILLWVAGAAGVILLVAAFKGKSPSDILSAYADTPKPKAKGDGNTADEVGNGATDDGGIATSVANGAQFAATANGGLEDIPSVYAQNPSLFVPSVTQ